MCDLYFHTMLFDVNFNWFSTIGLNNATVWDRCQVIIGFVSIIVAFASMYVAWLTYRMAEKVQKAIASNYAKQKQVEVMCAFVKELNDLKLQYNFYNTNRLGVNMKKGNDQTYCYNLFEIGELINRNEEEKAEFDDSSIFLARESQLFDSIRYYIINPMLPQNITDVLRSFYIMEFDRKTGPTDCEKPIVIGTITLYYYGVTSNALQNWRQLKKCSRQLSEAIKKWFEDNGILNCNIRIDYPKTTLSSKKV